MTTLTVAALAREAVKSKRGRSLTPILGTVSMVGRGSWVRPPTPKGAVGIVEISSTVLPSRV
jgi:hypothetical protein